MHFNNNYIYDIFSICFPYFFSSYLFLHTKHLEDNIYYLHLIHWPATLSFTLSTSSPILGLAPKHAWAVVLSVMGGRQRLLGDAYIPKRAQELSS